MRYQALSSESFNSKTPSPMDCIGLTSNLGGRPCCISRNEVPKSKRIDFGHDFRMFHESPSHDMVATRGFSPCATFSIYRKFSIIATSLVKSSGKIGRPSSALDKSHSDRTPPTRKMFLGLSESTSAHCEPKKYSWSYPVFDLPRDASRGDPKNVLGPKADLKRNLQFRQQNDVCRDIPGIA